MCEMSTCGARVSYCAGQGRYHVGGELTTLTEASFSFCALSSSRLLVRATMFAPLGSLLSSSSESSPAAAKRESSHLWLVSSLSWVAVEILRQVADLSSSEEVAEEEEHPVFLTRNSDQRVERDVRVQLRWGWETFGEDEYVDEPRHRWHRRRDSCGEMNLVDFPLIAMYCQFANFKGSRPVDFNGLGGTQGPYCCSLEVPSCLFAGQSVSFGWDGVER
jgi:hypothetical protein